MAIESSGENEIIAGLDLGTTKVCAIVAEVTDDGLDIIGVGSVPSRGLRRGVVVNIDSTMQAITDSNSNLLYTINYAADASTGATTGGNDVMITAVPEPTTISILTLSSIAVLTRRRRRTQQQHV